MKKEEFRIGNYVHSIMLGTSIISELKDDGVSIRNVYKKDKYFIHNNDINEVETIPLNYSVLSDLGFEYNDFSFQLDNLSIDDENRVIVIDRTGYGTIIARNILFVHQLQNIYFALTGKELRMNIHAKNNP